MTESVRPRQKFALLEAMRGLAASWVVFYHIERTGNLQHIEASWPSLLFKLLFRYGNSGVAIFFVLSGFVISHSLGNKPMHVRDFGRFAARRSLRLDPPYYASIALTIAISIVAAIARHREINVPGLKVLLIHALYLQAFFPGVNILPVYWTLSFEIQFYLVLALSQVLWTSLQDKSLSDTRSTQIVYAPLVALAILSASLAAFSWAPSGLFLTYWHGFFVGVLAYRVGYRRHSPIPLLLVCAPMIYNIQQPLMLGFIATVVVLLVASRTGWLETGLSSPPLQFLGKISYSLYLIHWPIAIPAFAIWTRAAGVGVTQELLGLILVFGFVSATSYGFWWIIERPSHRLAKRLFKQEPLPA